MDYKKIKNIGSLLLIVVGAVTLIVEISSPAKNYYLQSIGLILLMSGLFLVNTKVKSKEEIGEVKESNFEEE